MARVYKNLHGLQVWVAMGMGVGMDFYTCELQNEPKIIQNSSVLSVMIINHELRLF